MRKTLWLVPALAFMLCSGFVCAPAERVAYDTVVAAKGFTDKIKAVHPECSAGGSSTICTDLLKAIAAKDALIDAAEVYCAGPNFNGGGACDPPAKGTPSYAQASAKLQAAISSYSQSEKDLKAVLQ